MPATRQFAIELDISRFTVITAYEQLLHEERCRYQDELVDDEPLATAHTTGGSRFTPRRYLLGVGARGIQEAAQYLLRPTHGTRGRPGG